MDVCGSFQFPVSKISVASSLEGTISVMLSHKVWLYKTFVLPFLAHACESWTPMPLKEEGRKPSTRSANCQCHIAKICWQDHVWNTDISSVTGLDHALDPIIHSSLFGHVARLPEDTPAHRALQCHIDLSLGCLSYPLWRQCPGRPRNRCLNQLCRDNGTPPADLRR